MARFLPRNIFLPKPTTDGERALGRAIQEMYRLLVTHINGHVFSGNIADRPVSDGSLRLFWAEDTLKLSIDGPAGWHDIP